MADPNKPPSVPSGWLAKFDDKYKTWYYVNLETKKSQWEAPPSSDTPPGPPPSYNASNSKSSLPSQSDSGSHRASPNPGYQRGYPPQGQGRGGYGGYQQYPPQQYQQYPPQPYPQQYPPQPYPPQPYPQQYPPQQYAQPQRQSRMGGGMMPGLMMGAGAGLLGGMAMDAFADHERDEGYQDAMQDQQFNGGGDVTNNYYGDYNDYGGDMGGDMGDMGGDMGGDF